jgi:energy-coupling factor transporter ATP-binding protein EcfA2
MEKVLSITNLSFTYPGAEQPALREINFAVKAGEFLGITGPAGAGKSTLVLCLNGIIPYFQNGNLTGRVCINGQDTLQMSCAEIAHRIGSVFQDPEAQIVAPTVEDEVAFGLENFGVDPGIMECRISEALELIGITNLRLRKTQELSGGQKQRVAIAAAVALCPQILVLDEPTSELDPIGTIEVFEVLKTLRHRHQMTIVVVEQKINTLLEYSDRCIIMNNGSFICDRPPRQIIEAPEMLHEVGLQAPPVSELALLLQKDGLYTGQLPLSVSEAYRGLLRIFPDEEQIV